jgi:hypothetical protein
MGFLLLDLKIATHSWNVTGNVSARQKLSVTVEWRVTSDTSIIQRSGKLLDSQGGDFIRYNVDESVRFSWNSN